MSVQLHGSSQEQTHGRVRPDHRSLRSQQATIEGSNAEVNGGVAGAQANLPAAVRPDGTPVADRRAGDDDRRAADSRRAAEADELRSDARRRPTPSARVARSPGSRSRSWSTTSTSTSTAAGRHGDAPSASRAIRRRCRSCRSSSPPRSASTRSAATMITVENIAFEAPVSEPVAQPSLWQRVSDQSSGAVRGVAVLADGRRWCCCCSCGRSSAALLAVPALEHRHARARWACRSSCRGPSRRSRARSRRSSTPMPNDGDRRQPVLTRRVVDAGQQGAGERGQAGPRLADRGKELDRGHGARAEGRRASTASARPPSSRCCSASTPRASCSSTSTRKRSR